jgi:hypothetical protein
MSIFKHPAPIKPEPAIDLSDSAVHSITGKISKLSSRIARYFVLFLCLFLGIYEAQAGLCVIPTKAGVGVIN